jgi:hypothetical protein
MFDSDLHTYKNNLLTHKENARQFKIVVGECVYVTVTSYLVSIVYVHIRTVKNKKGGKRPERKHAEDLKESARKTWK